MRLLAIYNFCYVVEVAVRCVGRRLGSNVSSLLKLAELLLDFQKSFFPFFLLPRLRWGVGGAVRRLINIRNFYAVGTSSCRAFGALLCSRWAMKTRIRACGDSVTR